MDWGQQGSVAQQEPVDTDTDRGGGGGKVSK